MKFISAWIKVDTFNILLFVHLNFYTKAAKDPKENSDDNDDGTHRKRSMESNQERQNRLYTGLVAVLNYMPLSINVFLLQHYIIKKNNYEYDLI